MKTVVDLTNKVKEYAAAGKTIAPIENGTTSVGSYAIGEQFMREGVLYKAKTAITAGDTLTLNTNYELDDSVMEQLSQTKQALSDEQNIYGAKNILDFSKLLVVNPFVMNKVTYTFNKDTGIVTIVSDGASTNTVSPYCYLPTFSENTDVIVSVEGINSSKNDYLVYDFTASSTIDYGATEKTITLPANHLIGITIRSFSNKTFNETLKPMVRRCGDSTFVPFAKGNIELTKDDSGLTANEYLNGAVNLLENIGSSQVVGGVTFIVNADKTITTNGASLYPNDYSTLTVGSVTKIKVGERYKLIGCPSGGGIQKYHMYFVARDSSNAFIEYWQETGEGINITIPSGTVKIDAYVRCYYDVNVDGKVFKPMITVADMPNSDYNHYVPYRMSNGELTDALDAHTTGTRVDISSYTSTAYYTPSEGYLFLFNDAGKDGQMIIGDALNISIGGVPGRFALYVRKGTTVKVGGTPTVAGFVPLS